MKKNEMNTIEIHAPPGVEVEWVVIPKSGECDPMTAVAKTAHLAWQKTNCSLPFSEVLVMPTEDAKVVAAAMNEETKLVRVPGGFTNVPVKKVAKKASAKSKKKVR
jgi:hypothetical protein